ncbi:MAG: DUF1828 domain-containing protein, partial [Dehalococcoidia bacterium]|nr:DUF1828 domain-containing protein [Dehalococcoidia bacterium]
MIIEDIISEFKQKTCSEIGVMAQGLSRFLITHPFTFEDGDHFVVVLRKVGDAWEFTDQGHTLMHLSYEDLDLTLTGYSEIISNNVEAFGLQNKQGEFVLTVPGERFGDAFFSFIQALVKISDVKYL